MDDIPSNKPFYILGNNSTADDYITGVVNLVPSNITASILDLADCKRENSILYLLLMFGTLWLGVMLYNFNKT